MLKGKGAMVWQLRNWKGGQPQLQAQQARDLGLAWVSLKIVDGRGERWETQSAVPLGRQNVSLLPGTIEALRAAGIGVAGWGYTYGGYYRGTTFHPSQRIAQEEGAAAVPILAKHGLTAFQIDAEKEYRKGADRASRAETYCLGALSASTVELSLCSYRFPLSRASDFPTRAFAPFVENWSPQAYWIRDNRPHAGAAQLEVSAGEYQSIRPLPMTPIGPTYVDHGWRASPAQLRMFFEKAKTLGCCEGVGIWCLDQASPDQLAALAGFGWEDAPT